MKDSLLKYNDKQLDKFKIVYDKVFDSSGKDKNCGREQCRELIRLANTLEPGTSHGDLQTAFMKVDSIVALNSKL